MKILITGASGFVGRLLVPRLISSGIDLLLVGRDQELLNTLFPEVQKCSYTEIAAAGKGCDVALHLAVANTNSELSDDEFRSVNVGLLIEVAELCRAANIRQFINVSSVHTLQPNKLTPYANSKRAGVEALSRVQGLNIRNIYLPTVYGECWAGKLAALNRLPHFLSKQVFRPISALKPTMHIEKLVAYLHEYYQNGMTDNPVILADDKALNPWYRGTMRLIDLSFASLVAVFFWWALVLVAILIRIMSPGPAIFKQVRVGQNKTVFTCYKFRTMKVNTKQLGTHEISSDSITPFGAFLRRTKLDELPQVINIFRNELSLVGPRPCLPNQLELIKERDIRGVFAVKPGITGLAQINDIDMSIPWRLAQWDAKYIALRGLFSDMSIGLKTATGSGQGDKTSN